MRGNANALYGALATKRPGQRISLRFVMPTGRQSSIAQFAGGLLDGMLALGTLRPSVARQDALGSATRVSSNATAAAFGRFAGDVGANYPCCEAAGIGSRCSAVLRMVSNDVQRRLQQDATALSSRLPRQRAAADACRCHNWRGGNGWD